MTSTKWWLLISQFGMVISGIIESYNYLLIFGFILLGTKLHEIYELLEKDLKK